MRRLIFSVVISAGCLLTTTSCGLPFFPVDYHTDLMLEVCNSPSPVVASAFLCEPLTSNVAAVRSAVVTRLQSRSDAAQAQSVITIRSDGDIDVRTTLTSDEAVSVFTKTGSVAFATAVTGAPNPSDATFVADQRGRFDMQQFPDELLYPVGYHWKIDSELPGADIMSAVVGSDGTTGEVSVDITFNAAGATEWTRITNAAFAAYTEQSADPTGASQIAIFLDDDVITAPEVTGGGQSNQTEITGNFTVDSATALADYISVGALPAPVSIVSINGEAYTTTPQPG